VESEDLSAGSAGYASYGPKLLPREILSAGEEPVYETRPLLWLRLIPPLAFSLIPVGLLFAAAQPDVLAALFNPTSSLGSAAITGCRCLGLASLAVAFVWLGKRWLEWRYTIYAITTRRIIRQTGIIGKAYTDCSLRRVQAVYVDIPLWGRIFNFGTLRIATAGTAGVEITWPGVKAPRRVQRILGELIEEYSNRGYHA